MSHSKNAKIGIIFLFLILIVIIACQGKGNLSGNIVKEKDVPPSLSKLNVEIPDKIYKPKDQNVYLLKYDENLFARHEQLRSECAKKYKDKTNEFIKNAAELDRGAQNINLSHLILENYSIESKQILQDCGNLRNNLFFNKIVMTTKTNNEGHYEFQEVPYGKYYISFYVPVYWWLVPIEINKKDNQIDLNNQNVSSL
jgi:hypothetical protein